MLKMFEALKGKPKKKKGSVDLYIYTSNDHPFHFKICIHIQIYTWEIAIILVRVIIKRDL